MSCLTMLQVDHLSIGLGGGSEQTGTSKILVNDLSFTLRRGKTTALIGESGSGKSLTAMSLLGLLPPGVAQISGQITMTEGCEHSGTPAVWKLPAPKARGAHIGLIMQNPGSCFDPLFTIRHHFQETLSAHSITTSQTGSRDTFLQARLQEVGLTEAQRVLDSYPFQLSGGMLQRLMIALSLLPNPEILLADEPFSSLDHAGQIQLMDLLQALQKQHNFAMLFISHDIGCALRMAHDIMVMQSGTIVEQGPVSLVASAPTSAYTQELLAAHEVMESYPSAPLKNAPSCGVPILECRNISKTYSSAHGFWGRKQHLHCALRDVSLSLSRGESLGLVGCNGSGKSTLIRILLGLETPDSGVVLLHGKTLGWHQQNTGNTWRRHIQIVFQDSRQAVNPRFTVEQIVAEPLLAHGEKNIRQQCLTLLDAVGLEASANEFLLSKRPMQCSGGQLQRVCLARALALQPDIILLDESLCDLDLVAQAQILALLGRLREEKGLSLLFVSHDRNMVRHLCQRVLTMEELSQDSRT